MTTPQERQAQRKQEEINFYTKYYTQLVGAKITGFELVQDESDDHILWPTFTAKKAKIHSLLKCHKTQKEMVKGSYLDYLQ